MFVLITGASSGIGAATAQALARRGDTVALVARTKDKLEQLAQELGPNAHAFPCDVSNENEVAAMAAAVRERLGLPDAIVNSAGGGQWKSLADSTPADFRAAMSAPYFAAAFVSGAFAKDMLKRGSGTLIHINSPVAKVPFRNAVGYVATRGALQSFHEALVQDFAGTGLSSCHVIFGRVDTEYFANNPGSEDHMPWIDKLVPTSTAEACAHVILQTLKRPRVEVLHPFMLRPTVLAARLFPGLMRWAARF